MKNKAVKIVVTILIVCALLAAAIVGGLAWYHKANYVGNEAALKTALGDAALSRGEVRDVNVELEREFGTMRYEVEFEKGADEYNYIIDAKTGEILDQWTER